MHRPATAVVDEHRKLVVLRYKSEVRDVQGKATSASVLCAF